MRTLARIRNGFGLLALAISFALASPGVQVSRAETLQAEAVGPQCQAVAESAHSKDEQLAMLVAQVRAEAARPDAPARRRVMGLNNRGHNYANDGVLEMDVILKEMEAGR